MILYCLAVLKSGVAAGIFSQRNLMEEMTHL